MFTSYRRIKSIPVKLPNGSNAIAEFSGDVHLSDSIILTDVLYLPSFSFHLISVSRLTKGSSYCCVFSDKTCFIQDIPHTG